MNKKSANIDEQHTIAIARARQMRTNQTDAEQRMWFQLRAHRLLGLKFKRQYPLGPYIVDFVCLQYGLIIELDGGQHAENVEYDRQRDAWLKAQGFVVLRFWNHQVMQELDAVLEALRLAVIAIRGREI